MYQPHPPRAVSALVASAITGLVVAVLVFGFGAEAVRQKVPTLVSVALEPPPPPPLKPKQKPAERRTDTRAAPKDEAGRRNLRNEATAVVAPPVVRLIVPPPVVVAPIANTGSAKQTGASPVPGPGEGAGMYGDGRGGGGTGGEGDGSGDGEMDRPPRQIGGQLSYRDLPAGTLALGEEARVTVLYMIETDGSATGCRVQESSGFPVIDSLTCRLIEHRFRFRPALDVQGRTMRLPTRQNHHWYARPE